MWALFGGVIGINSIDFVVVLADLIKNLTEWSSVLQVKYTIARDLGWVFWFFFKCFLGDRSVMGVFNFCY